MNTYVDYEDNCRICEESMKDATFLSRKGDKLICEDCWLEEEE